MKKNLSLCLAVILALSLCACGNNRSADEREVPAQRDQMLYEEAAMPKAAAGFNALNGYSDSYSVVEDNTVSQESTQPETNPDKIIYSADATLETTVFDETVKKIDEMIAKYNGWVESSSVSGANYSDISLGRAGSRSASYTLRIPSESFDEVMSGLNTLGNVPYSRVYTENVTAQYYDTEARLESYKTQEQSLLRLMEKAESVEDIITIEDKLTEVRYHIESLQSSLNNWDRQVAYSYIYLNVNEVAEYTPEQTINPGFGERFSRAVKNGFEAAGDFLSGLVIGLVEILPTLVIIAAAITVLVLIIRASVRRKKAKKAAKKAEETK